MSEKTSQSDFIKSGYLQNEGGLYLTQLYDLDDSVEDSMVQVKRSFSNPFLAETEVKPAFIQREVKKDNARPYFGAVLQPISSSLERALLPLEEALENMQKIAEPLMIQDDLTETFKNDIDTQTLELSTRRKEFKQNIAKANTEFEKAFLDIAKENIQ